MLEFKWKSYAQSLYWINAAYFLIFLILVVASSISASRAHAEEALQQRLRRKYIAGHVFIPDYVASLIVLPQDRDR